MEYRGYVIAPANNLMGYVIKYDGKGSVHSSLQGNFTSRGIAQSFIDKYLERKEEPDGEIGSETDSSSGSEQVQRRPYHRRKSPN